MKSVSFNFPRTTLLIASFAMVVGVGCSSESGNQTTSEEDLTQETTATTPATEEEEPADEMMEDSTMNNDMQVTRVQPEPVKKPENKEPVLTALSTSYKEWNKDGDNVLNRDEFYQGLYDVWDNDKNGDITETEFMEGTDQFFTDYNVKEYGDYSEWDVDANGTLSMEEFRQGMRSTVDQDPTAQDLLVIWDTDNDDAIERIELDNITVRLDQDSN